MLPGDLARVTVPWCSMREESAPEARGRDLCGGGIALVVTVRTHLLYALVLYCGVLGWIHAYALEVL